MGYRSYCIPPTGVHTILYSSPFKVEVMEMPMGENEVGVIVVESFQDGVAHIWGYLGIILDLFSIVRS